MTGDCTNHWVQLTWTTLSQREESPGYPNLRYPGNLGEMSNEAEKALKRNSHTLNVSSILTLRNVRA